MKKMSPGVTVTSFPALLMLGLSLLFFFVGSTKAAVTNAERLDFVRNTWDVTSLTDDTLVNTFDASYSGIPFKSWIDFFIHAPDYMGPLLQGDYSKAASRATDYFAGATIDATLEYVGLLGVSAPAQLAAWPIQQALADFNQTVNDIAFKHQCELYFQARTDGNTAQEILNSAPGDLLPHSAIFKIDQRWLAQSLTYNPSFPNFITPEKFHEYAELLWQAKDAYTNSYSSDNQTVAAQFRLAAAPGIPVISVQPQSQSINSGGTAIFTVQATGTGILHYYWKFNGVVIFGVDAPSFSASQAGTYSVLVYNTAGQVSSQVAALTVNSGPPSLVQQPASRSVLSGSTVVFGVVASGSGPLSYQWQRNGADIAGATGATYSVTAQPSNNGALFSVHVSNSLGSVTSLQASLSLASPTNITWTGAHSGEWFDYRNWSPQIVPAGSDYITINSGSVTVPSGYSLEYIALAGGSLSGFFAITGTLNWTAGTLAPGTVTIAAGGALNISGGNAKFFSGGTLNNAGTANFSGSGPLYEQNGATFNDLAGGTFKVIGDAAIYNNGGAQSAFNSAGVIDIQAGALTFGGINPTVSGGVVKGAGHFASTTINLTGSVTFAGFEFSEGNLVTNDAAAITGTLNWTGGTISPGTLGIASGAVLNISGGSAKFLSGGALNNAGTVNFSGSGPLYEQNGAAINNLAGGTFNMLDDAAIYNNGGAQPTFNNAGTFRKSGGSGTATVGLTFNNTGLVDIVSGSFSMGGSYNNDGTTNIHAGTLTASGGGASSGVFNTSPGATTLLSGGSLEFGPSISFIGGGVIRANATFILNGEYGFQGLEITGGQIVGAFTIKGSLTWSSGTLSFGTVTVASGGVFNISGGSGKFLSGGALNNAGTVNFSGGVLYAQNGAAINNLAGGTFNVLDDTAIYNNGGAQPSFNNAGTFRKSGGVGSMSINLPFNSSGLVDAQSGSITINGGGASNGVFNAAAGAANEFAAASLTDGASFTGAGVNRITGSVSLSGSLSSQNLELAAGTLGGNATITGTLNWTAGTLAPGTVTIAAGGELNISGGSGKFFSGGTLNNAGTVNFSGSGPLYEQNGATFNDLAGGTFKVIGDAAIYNNGGAQSAFNSAGVIDIQAGALTFGGINPTVSGGVVKGAGHFASTTINLTGSVTFAGFEFSEGNLVTNDAAAITGTLNWTGGTISPGTLGIASGGVLNISGGSGKFLSGGTLNNAGTVNLSGSGPLYAQNGAAINNIAGGTFNVLDDAAIYNNGGAQPSFNNAGTFRKSGGSGTTTVGLTFNNTGLVDIVSGFLNLGSSYTQSSVGELSVGIRGTTAGTQFGKLVVSGQAVLDGLLNVTFLNGFQTGVGNSFRIFEYGSRTGNFSGISATNLNNDLTLTPNLSTSSLTLTTVLTGYAQWKLNKYGANAGNPAIAGDAVDPDNAGIPNLLKYAFNTDAPGAGRSRLPRTATERDFSDNKFYLTLTYSQRVGSTELNYTVEVSDNLSSWDGTGAQLEQVGAPVPNTDGVTERMKVRFKIPVANLTRKFLRVSVSRN